MWNLESDSSDPRRHVGRDGVRLYGLKLESDYGGNNVILEIAPNEYSPPKRNVGSGRTLSDRGGETNESNAPEIQRIPGSLAKMIKVCWMGGDARLPISALKRPVSRPATLPGLAFSRELASQL